MTALEIIRRLVYLQARLRLRSPATPAEIKAWAELRRDALAVLENNRDRSKDVRLFDPARDPNRIGATPRRGAA